MAIKIRVKTRDNSKPVKTNGDNKKTQSEALRETTKPNHLGKSLHSAIKSIKFKEGSKPHIDEVISAFDKFRLSCNAVQIAQIRNPGKWEANMATAQKELIAALTDLGLAKHIDFNKDRD